MFMYLQSQEVIMFGMIDILITISHCKWLVHEPGGKELIKEIGACVKDMIEKGT